MARVRRLLETIWNLRRHRQRWVRLLWWVCAFLLLRAIIRSEEMSGIAVGFLAIASVGVSTVASLWGLTHPRILFQVRNLALRWSLVLSIVGTLCLVSVMGASFSEATNVAFPTGAIFVFSLLVTLPLFFVLALPVSLFGAAMSAWDSRKQPDLYGAARRGVNAIWCVIGATLLADQWLRTLETPETIFVGLYLLLPFFTRIWSQSERQEWFIGQFKAFLAHMEARLIRTRRRRDGTIRTLDLRGAALGVVAALLVLLASWIGILIGIRAPLLASLVQLRNTTTRYWTGNDTDFLSMVVRDEPERRRKSDVLRQARSKIVLMEMDGATRYAAHQSTSSEAAVQAQIIAKLKSAMPEMIILPLPVLDTSQPPFPSRLPDALPLQTSEVERSRRDAVRLSKAMRNTGRIALMLPDTLSENVFNDKTAEKGQSRSPVNQLMGAADWTGTFGIGSYGTAKLAVITVTAQREHDPIPLVVLSAASTLPESPSMIKALSDHVMISGRRVPLIAPEKIALDFQDAEPGHDFARVDYRDVLENRLLFAPTADKEPGSQGAGRWLKPDDYFRNKIVILDTFAPFTRETPVGKMASNELQAYAAAMMLSGEYLGRVSNRGMIVVTLLLSAIMGNWCVRKPPLHAGWRLAVICIVIAAVCTGLILQGVWLDPVIPTAAALGTFLLVTQFTFGMEQRVRTEHRRLLDRLVAPEFLEELLEDPEGKLGLQGRRQSLCVLFADVRGFTKFAEENSPERVVEIINAYMAPLTQSLLKYGGILDKYTGDGLMALFRIHANTRQDVSQAVHAALAMRCAAEEVSERLKQEGKTVLHIGFGIHYGEAVVGLVGMPPDKVNYTALGHTVVISQRLQSLAAGGEIIISDAVFQTVGDTFEVQEGEPVTVKGSARPVRPYLVIASNAPPEEED
jgi:class 3 adenylate cyclase